MLTREQLEQIGFARIGKNVLVSEKASIYRPDRISLGDNIRIDDFCILSAGAGGIALGDYNHLGAFTILIGHGRIELSDFVSVSSRVSIYSSSDDYSGNTLANPTVPPQYKAVKNAPVTLGRQVMVAAGAVILPGVTVGEGCAIGALSLVNRTCKPFGIYFGAPVRRIKERSRRVLDLERQLLSEQLSPE